MQSTTGKRLLVSRDGSYLLPSFILNAKATLWNFSPHNNESENLYNNSDKFT